MKKIFVSFLLILTLVCNSPMFAYASSFGGGGGTHDMTGFNNWDTGDKVAFWSTNLPAIIAGSIGLVINPLNWNYDTWLTTFLQSANSMGVALDSENYYDYVANMLSVNDDNALVVQNDLTDIMYNASLQYIEEETGYFVIPTLSSKDLVASNFYNKDTFDMFKNYINNLGTDICICRGYYGDSYAPIIRTIKDGENVNYDNNPRSYGLFRFASNYGLVGNKISYTYNTNFAYLNSCSVYDASWNVCYNKEFEILDFISLSSAIPYMNTSYEYNATEGDLFLTHSNIRNMSTELYFDDATAKHQNSLFTSDGRSIRVYKTLEDFKNYSAGTRPYYITDAFKNYDSTIDNSTTITQTEIDNSVTYGDVYNYITNNYENPDGLSEDELRAILAEYLSQINNNGGSGSGSGSGNSGGSGGGLSGFLDGLGSLGDALLAIIGKLLEYVGKAIELLSGTVTKVIDLVPQNITNLISGLFPFIPQEWLVAIELSLVLAVVIGIVGIFKK